MLRRIEFWKITPIFVGIDVSKARLDVSIRPRGERDSVADDKVGIKALVKRLEEIQPTLIVMEATGSMERQSQCSTGWCWTPRGCRQSASGPRLCQSYRPAGQDRQYRCLGVGSLC